MKTITNMPVWQRAAQRAAALSPQVWTYGRPSDPHIVWAAGPGTPSFEQFAEEGAAAVVFVEWRRPESFSDDDASRGGFKLDVRSGSTRVYAYASIFADGDSPRLGQWRDGDDKAYTPPHAILALVTASREWK